MDLGSFGSPAAAGLVRIMSVVRNEINLVMWVKLLRKSQ